MFQTVLEYPRSRTDATTTLAIGTALQSFALFLVPIVFVMGYLVAVMKDSFAGDAEPPAFDNVGQLGRDGLFGTAILFVYLLIPMIVTGVLVAATGGLGAVSGNEDLAAMTILVSLLIAVVVGGTLALLFSYAGIAALANFAYHDSPAAAFAVGDLVGILTDGEFFKSWLVGVGVLVLGSVVAGAINFALGIVLGIISIIPLIGLLIGIVGTVVQWLVASAIAFYVSVSAYRAYALGFADAVGASSA